MDEGGGVRTGSRGSSRRRLRQQLQQQGDHTHPHQQQQQQQHVPHAEPACVVTPALGVLSVYKLHMGAPVALVACGASHTIVAMAQRGVWVWGSNSHGQVGVELRNPGVCDGRGNVCTPVRVRALRDTRVVCVSGGGATSAAVTEEGRVWMWGDGSWGQCGQGNTAFKQAPAWVDKGLEGVRVTQVR